MALTLVGGPFDGDTLPIGIHGPGAEAQRVEVWPVRGNRRTEPGYDGLNFRYVTGPSGNPQSVLYVIRQTPRGWRGVEKGVLDRTQEGMQPA